MKASLTSSLVTVLVCSFGVSAGFYATERTPSMSTTIHVKDLTRIGLRLVGPKDAEFEQIAESFLGGSSADLQSTIKPFAVLVRNESLRAVAGYIVVWRVELDDGSIRTFPQAFLTPALLQGARSSEAPFRKYALAPGCTHFCSPVVGAPRGAYTYRQVIQEPTTDLEEQLRQANIEFISVLRQSRAIEVSLDGAFFEDGTFVGPNSRKFFEQVRGQIDGERAVLEEFSRELKAGVDSSDILVQAGQRGAQLDPGSVSADADESQLYHYWYKMSFELTLEQLREAKSPNDVRRTITRAVDLLERPWPQLKKATWDREDME
jgi:hypothetical protein